MRLLTVLLLLALSTAALANPRDRRVQAQLDQLAGTEAAIFAVMKGNGYGFGNIKVYTSGDIDEDSILRFGSITKVFTSDVALDVLPLSAHPVEQGFSPLDYTKSDVITYRQLMSHTSGVPEFLQFLGFNETTGEFIPAEFSVAVNVDLGWKDKPLDFPPGSLYSYSNTGTEITALAVERVTGKSVAQHIKERWGAIAPSLKLDDGTTPVSAWPNTTAYNPWFYPVELPGASGTLIGTASDLLKAFSVILRKNNINIRRQWNTVPAVDGPGAGIAAGDKYGICWQRYDSMPGGPAEGHDGDYVVRSIVLDHRRTNAKYLVHYAAPMSNSQLVQETAKLIAAYNRFRL